MPQLQKEEDGAPCPACQGPPLTAAQRCDGQRPVCGQCIKGNRDDECQFHDKKQISRTEMLRAKVAKLEARLRELEVEHSGSSSSTTPAPMSPLSPSPSTTRSSPSEDLILLQAPGNVLGGFTTSQHELTPAHGVAEGNSLPSSSPAPNFDWEDDDLSGMGAGPSNASSSSTPSLNNFFDLPSFLNDSFFPAPADYSPGIMPQEAPSYWEDPDVMCQSKQKLFVSSHDHALLFILTILN